MAKETKQYSIQRNIARHKKAYQLGTQLSLVIVIGLTGCSVPIKQGADKLKNEQEIQVEHFDEKAREESSNSGDSGIQSEQLIDETKTQLDNSSNEHIIEDTRIQMQDYITTMTGGKAKNTVIKDYFAKEYTSLYELEVDERSNERTPTISTDYDDYVEPYKPISLKGNDTVTTPNTPTLVNKEKEYQIQSIGNEYYVDLDDLEFIDGMALVPFNGVSYVFTEARVYRTRKYISANYRPTDFREDVIVPYKLSSTRTRVEAKYITKDERVVLDVVLTYEDNKLVHIEPNVEGDV